MPTYADILNKKKKDWNCPDLTSGHSGSLNTKIPFSSPLVNHSTYGGVPRRRMIEFLGVPGGGKTSSAIDVCKNGIKQFREEFELELSRLRDLIASGKKEYAGPLEDLQERGPKRVVYMDLEHTYDKKWAKIIGVDDGDIELWQPPDVEGEEILQAIEDMVETGEIGLIVLDSTPSLVPKQELDKKYGERTVASLAGLMTVFCRKIIPKLDRYDCTIIMINQTRANMDNPYSVNSPGGEAIKFYSSLRILFKLGVPVDFAGNELPTNTENPAGHLINTKILKQKTGSGDRKNGSYFLMFKTGIRPDFDYAKLAINRYGIIRKAGGWYTMADPFTGEILSDETGKTVKVNGLVHVYDYLQNNPEYFDKVKSYIQSDIEGKELNAEGSDVLD